MVTNKQRAPRLRDRGSIADHARAFLRLIEPWYDWGTIYIERMEGTELDRDNGEGEVWYFQLQWFGIHLGLQVGRTPKARS